NVRELRNIIDRGAAMSDRYFRIPDDFGESVELDGADGMAPGSGVGLVDDDNHFEAPKRTNSVTRIGATGMPLGQLTKPLWDGRTYKDAKAAVMADFEQGYIQALLEEHRGNVSAAARAAGIHRNILHRMMARYGIGR